MSDRAIDLADLLSSLLELVNVRVPQLEAEQERLRAENDALKKKLRAIPGRCFTEKAACSRLGGIDRGTIKRLRDNGEIGFARIGTRVVYPRRDLDEFIDRNSMPSRYARRLRKAS
jgi:excisionase family DNA binding protein